MKTKLLLDTDIGTDIDDAVCLAYLLAHPDCDLLGITTVTGESVPRARMASALCRVAGRDDIPIHPGVATPLLIPQRQSTASQAAALHKWEHRTDLPPPGEAVQFLRDTIRRHPHEVVLLAIGPLTNVGLLFATDPEIPSLLKQLVLMCGVFTNRCPGWGPLEWNAMCDPHATAIVYRGPVKHHRSVGLDVTTRVTMAADDVRRRFQAPLLKPVLDFAEIWFQHRDRITFHDPLAAAAIFDDAICSFETGIVDIELHSQRLLGMTHWSPEETGPHQVALEVDAERFFNEFFARFN